MSEVWMTCNACGEETPKVPALELAERIMMAHVEVEHPDRVEKYAAEILTGNTRTPAMLARAL